MLQPTYRALERAISYQDHELTAETSSPPADPIDALRAAIGARRDVSKLVGMQEEAHHQLVMISRGVWCGVALLALIASELVLRLH